MGQTEQRIVGALVMHALTNGIDVDASGAGNDALLRFELQGMQATLHLKLDGGTDMITDAVGEEALYAQLLEVAQNECDAIWRAA